MATGTPPVNRTRSIWDSLSPEEFEQLQAYTKCKPFSSSFVSTCDVPKQTFGDRHHYPSVISMLLQSDHKHLFSVAACTLRLNYYEFLSCFAPLFEPRAHTGPYELQSFLSIQYLLLFYEVPMFLLFHVVQSLLRFSRNETQTFCLIRQDIFRFTHRLLNAVFTHQATITYLGTKHGQPTYQIKPNYVGMIEIVCETQLTMSAQSKGRSLHELVRSFSLIYAYKGPLNSSEHELVITSLRIFSQ